MKILFISKAFFRTAIILAPIGALSQTAGPNAGNPNACRIIGTDTVSAGSVASFTLSPCTAGQWSVSCDTIVNQSPTSVTVRFPSGTCNSMILSATGGGASGVSKTITVVAPMPFAAGLAQTASNLSIGYNRIPALLQVGPATGGLCGGSATYQWLASTDSIHFSVLTDATGQNYQSGPLSVTTWFKRQASCPSSGAVATHTIKVAVSPKLTSAMITPALQTINGHAMATPLNIATAAARYQWQSAVDPAFTTVVNIAGATSATFSPDSLAATTYYRVLLINPGDSSYSPSAVISVLPPISTGGLVPASQTVATDSVPDLLTCSGLNGGNGTYSFQWFSSPDGNNWTLLAGVETAGYNPGPLISTTWYRVQVSSNGIPVTSPTAVIHVNP